MTQRKNSIKESEVSKFDIEIEALRIKTENAKIKLEITKQRLKQIQELSKDEKRISFKECDELSNKVLSVLKEDGLGFTDIETVIHHLINKLEIEKRLVLKTK